MFGRLFTPACLLALILGALVLGLAPPALADKGSLAKSETIAIDLYTMGEGDALFERFGHAALCVRHLQEPNRDLCYNYGSTNFSAPAKLAWDFVRGRSLFWVSTLRPGPMVDFYVRRDRSVWVQELPLTQSQAQLVADKLAFDARKENRDYIYHVFWDNCTTRVRDILNEVTGQRFAKKERLGMSLRDLTRRGFSNLPLLLVGTDLVLGRVGEEDPTRFQAMYLPEVFRAEVERELHATPELLYKRQGPVLAKAPAPVRVYYLLASLLLALPVAYGLVRARLRARHLILPLAVLSLLGLILWLLAILSPLPMFRHNEALLVLMPSDVAILWLRRRWRAGYSLARLVCVGAALGLWAIGVFVQPLWLLSALPLLVMALVLIDSRRN